jgi:integrase
MAGQIRTVNPECLEAFLARHPATTTGTILRLAWLQGLTREELCALTWMEVDFEEDCLHVGGRRIPIDAKMRPCLEKRWELYHMRSKFVVLSERNKTPLTPQSVSRLARMAFEEMGQKELQLVDLRHDYILRLLKEQDWPCAARLSGMSVATLQNSFGKYITRPQEKQEKAVVDEFALWKVMQSERTSPAGLALWLTWQLNLRQRELCALTWEQVNLEEGTISVDGRTLTLTAKSCWPILPSAHITTNQGANQNAGR